MINKCSEEQFPMYQYATIHEGEEQEAAATSLSKEFGQIDLIFGK